MKKLFFIMLFLPSIVLAESIPQCGRYMISSGEVSYVLDTKTGKVWVSKIGMNGNVSTGRSMLFSVPYVLGADDFSLTPDGKSPVVYPSDKNYQKSEGN